jgi:hypothetical protein
MEQSFPWKVTSVSASQEFPTFYGTQKFITVFKTARHLFLSWARSIQSTLSHRIYLRSILVLSSHLRLRLSNGHFSSAFPTKSPYEFFFMALATRHIPIRNYWLTFILAQ